MIEGLEDRWNTLRKLLHCLERDQPISKELVVEFSHFAMIGASGLRRMLAGTSDNRQYREQMTAVVALTGRLMDIGSTMAQMPYQLLLGDKEQIALVLIELDEIQAAVAKKAAPPVHQLDYERISGIPLLPEVLRTVNLIPRVFSGDEPSGAYVPSALDITHPRRSSCVTPSRTPSI